MALYNINRQNVLTEDGLDNSVPVGSEYSRGVEVSGDVKITDQWALSANVAYDEARYGTFKFSDAVTGADVNASGNALPGLTYVDSSSALVLTNGALTAGPPSPMSAMPVASAARSRSLQPPQRTAMTTTPP